MEQRDKIKARLEAVQTASRLMVRRLRRAKVSPVIVSQFVNLSIKAMSLRERQDYLLPTFRRYADALELEFEYAMQDIHARYPDMATELPPADQLAAPMDEPTETRRVALTLTKRDWRIVDMYISKGHVKTYAAYFRRLVKKYQSEE